MHRSTWARTRSSSPVVDRPDLEIDSLDRAEGTLHLGQAFVRGDDLRVAHGVRGQIGADHIDAVAGRRGGDFGLPTAKSEAVVGDLDVECLAIL